MGQVIHRQNPLFWRARARRKTLGIDISVIVDITVTIPAQLRMIEIGLLIGGTTEQPKGFLDLEKDDET